MPSWLSPRGICCEDEWTSRKATFPVFVYSPDTQRVSMGNVSSRRSPRFHSRLMDTIECGWTSTDVPFTLSDGFEHHNGLRNLIMNLAGWGISSSSIWTEESVG